MKNRSVLIILLFGFLILITYQTCGSDWFAEASKRRIHVDDNLDDVVDDEEDEAWREWGKKKQPEFDPPPTDFTGMGLQEMQEELMKRQLGPVFGFVKLVPGTRRTPEMVSDVAMKWTNVARTGAIEATFTGVDLSTIMFTMQKGQDSLELKEFILSQSDAYEIKIGDQLFRRPGDRPFEEVFEKIQTEKEERHHEL
ncbi:uncharacterized protein LOC142552954 [Primulina tabacum]|uniref:uncharacterized protein LOC142552954 n=1 Tax=Primulina tabacum TaxID=48773 RepID=UPI003F590F0D